MIVRCPVFRAAMFADASLFFLSGATANPQPNRCGNLAKALLGGVPLSDPLTARAVSAGSRK